MAPTNFPGQVKTTQSLSPEIEINFHSLFMMKIGIRLSNLLCSYTKCLKDQTSSTESNYIYRHVSSRFSYHFCRIFY